MLPTVTSMLPCLHAILAACCDLSEDPLTFGETFQFPAVYKNKSHLETKTRKGHKSSPQLQEILSRVATVNHC